MYPLLSLYIVKWCSGVACNWCTSLDIALSLALNIKLVILCTIGRNVATARDNATKIIIIIYDISLKFFDTLLGHSMSDQRVFCDDLLRFVLNLARL